MNVFPIYVSNFQPTIYYIQREKAMKNVHASMDVMDRERERRSRARRNEKRYGASEREKKKRAAYSCRPQPKAHLHWKLF